jgi:hypothetical protein
METKKRKTFQTSPDMVGKYINEHVGSDAYPVGKIIAVKSKTILVVQPIEAECTKNDYTKQEYNYIETGEPILVRLTTSRDDYKQISDKPYKYLSPHF